MQNQSKQLIVTIIKRKTQK